MPEQPVELRCPYCQRPVFDGANVVRCSKCEGLHHEPCWERAQSCKARAGCRGKPQPVVVVRVPQPLDAAELSAVAGKAAADHVAEVALPRIEATVATRATADDVRASFADLERRLRALETALREVVRSETAELRTDVEKLGTRVDAGASIARRLTTQGTVIAKQVTDAVRSEMESRFSALEERIASLTGDAYVELETANRSLQQQLEATHFAVDGARRPFSWEGGDAARTGKRRKG